MENSIFLGIDIGGTKCTVSVAKFAGELPTVLGSMVLETRKEHSPSALISSLVRNARALSSRFQDLEGIGVTCGGPLSQAAGTILGSPNLPGWNEVPIVKIFSEAFGVPTILENDANAGALAEYRWGAGQGSTNMAFQTFGTGFGAGLILGGRLFSGTKGCAGEIGHLRMAKDGPVGFGKAGSLEGFCSGGGIQRQAQKAGHPVSAKEVFDSAEEGADWATEIIESVATKLGESWAILNDTLDLDLIVVGGIYPRQQALLSKVALRTFEREALSPCPVAPAMLGDRISIFAPLAICACNFDVE